MVYGYETGHGRTLLAKCAAAASMRLHVDRTAYVTSLICNYEIQENFTTIQLQTFYGPLGLPG